MIVIPYEAIEPKEKETIHTACERIKRTQKRAASGGYTSVEMMVNGQKRKLTSAYAPATPADRPGFFRAITPRLTRRTVLGIDANCVPDTTLDLKRDSSFPYNDSGANQLRDAVDDRGLIDVL